MKAIQRWPSCADKGKSHPGILLTLTSLVRHQSHNMKDEDEIDGAQWLAWDSLGPFLDLGLRGMNRHDGYKR